MRPPTGWKPVLREQLPRKPMPPMNRIQLNQVRASLEWFRPCGPALVAQVVRQLADNHPRVRAFLPDDTSTWHARWFATLAQVVANLHTFQAVEGGLGVLGTRAAARGVTPAHMAVVRDELLVAMSRLAGEDWTDALHEAWTTTLDAAIGAMIHTAPATAPTPARRAA